MRIVCILGAVVSAAGFFFSTFVNNVVLLMVLFGIVAGTGLGLMYVPAVVSVGYYFDKKRAFATGFVCSGSGAGTFILAPFAAFLLIQVSQCSFMKQTSTFQEAKVDIKHNAMPLTYNLK